MTEPDLAARFEAACAIARAAGGLALRYFRGRDRLEIKSKGVQDLTSDADHAVETMIRKRLAACFSGDGVLGEEQGLAQGSGAAAGTWVIDPIDGTACFVNGIPVWCVSIAFVRGGEVEIGVIYDPNADELFAARRGAGATLNGAPIRTSAATSVAEGTVGIGYSPRTDPDPAVTAIARLLAEGGMFQRNGSGALMLAYVAAGRLIGYYEAHINAWDCLAGVALVREAGGWTNDFLAGDGLIRGNPIVAAAPALAEPLRRLAGFEPQLRPGSRAP